MKKILRYYDSFEEKLLIFSLVFNVILVFTQIVMRSIFNTSLSWSEELSRYIFIWQTWMGVSIAFREGEHIRVNMIYEIIKSEKIKGVIKEIANIIWLVFNLFLAYQGFKLLQSMVQRNALSSGMRLPLVYVYAALPVSAVILSIRMILNYFIKEDKKEMEA